MLKITGPIASIPALCLSKPNSAALNRIFNQLPKTQEEWESWLECVLSNQIAPLVLSSISKHKILIPNWIKNSLEKSSETIRLKNRLRRAHLRVLLSRFNENKIPVILLNKDAISFEIYQDYDYTLIEDVHILIQPNYQMQVYNLYQSLQYITLNHKLNDWNHSLDKNIISMSSWPYFYNSDFTLPIKTHWKLHQNVLNKSEQQEALWFRSHSFTYDGIKTKKLSNEDIIHHLCLQYSKGLSGARNLIDLYNCLSQWTDFNWSEWNQLVINSNTQESVFFTLSLSQSFFSIPKVTEFLEYIGSQIRNKKLLESLDNKMEKPQEILTHSMDYDQKINNLYLTLKMETRLFPKMLSFISLLKLILHPPTCNISKNQINDGVNHSTKITAFNRLKLNYENIKHTFSELI